MFHACVEACKQVLLTCYGLRSPSVQREGLSLAPEHPQYQGKTVAISINLIELTTREQRSIELTAKVLPPTILVWQ
ncbi:hypothetical protein [Nostoc sp. CHAB 5715]|uniref:hypothetical protein n=1 Tax=Nostoc sp. CHAB 5715 TaxID=2780400 RepID=UPI001E2C079F|nr:hypothetical protein [Nostoc sp. CHAB 5715]MCC5625754.1 hypothetical protein [Nostoc sp. CHAB 5715]